MPIPDGHYLDLVDGRFAGTSPAQLDAMFQRIRNDAAGKHLVIHFHGGLVTRQSAHESGAILYETYRNAGTYPVFFVWNTGLFQTLRHNLDEIAKEKAFRRLVLRVGQLMLGKLGEIALPPGARSASDRLDPPSLKELPKDLEALQAELDAREQALPGDPTTVSELSEAQEEQAERELATDQVIREEAERIANGLRDPGQVNAEMGSRSGSTVRGSTSTNSVTVARVIPSRWASSARRVGERSSARCRRSTSNRSSPPWNRSARKPSPRSGDSLRSTRVSPGSMRTSTSARSRSTRAASRSRSALTTRGPRGGAARPVLCGALGRGRLGRL